MTREAWFCPSCRKHHGPHVDTCPGPVDAISDRTTPVGPGAIPAFPAPTIWPGPNTVPQVPSLLYPQTTCGAICEADPNVVVVN